MGESPEYRNALKASLAVLTLGVGGLAVKADSYHSHPPPEKVYAQAFADPVLLPEFPFPTITIPELPAVTVTLPAETTTTTVSSPPSPATEAQPLPITDSAPPAEAAPQSAPDDGPTANEKAYLDCIGYYESTSDPTRVDDSGRHFGKYQFLQSTWDAFVVKIGRDDLKGAYIPDVDEATQDYVALMFLRAGNRSQWSTDPNCSHLLHGED
ncbi:MAG TPA: hypothetical protein VLE74_02090 [Candidatus Saccharimonadales bacterium]|nr:hypothetical protein [Candidatus Saccharimonadales bacterium]